MKKIFLIFSVLYFTSCVPRHEVEILNKTNFSDWAEKTKVNFTKCCDNSYFLDKSEKFNENLSQNQLRERIFKLLPRINKDFNTFTYLHMLESMNEPVDTAYSATIWFDDSPIYYVFNHTEGDNIHFEKVGYKSKKFEAYKTLIDTKWNTLHNPCCPQFVDGLRRVGSFSTLELRDDTAIVVGNWVNMN
jgi:hypothetical protein